MLEIAAQSNPCSISIDFQPIPHVLRWKGGRIYLFLGEWRSIFFAQQVFTSLVLKPSIKTDFVHWHCSLPFRIFANSQQTRLQPNWSFALLSSHCKYKARPRRACACLPSCSMQQASGAFKRERSRTVKDLVKHATIVSLFTFCNRTTAPDWSRASSESRRERSSAERSAKKTLSLVLLRQNCPSTGPFLAIIHAKQKWNRQKHLASTLWRIHGAAWTFASTVPPAYSGHLLIAHNAYNV